jgi:hypothetical protein
MAQENKRLKGINLGGWLLMEGYILGGRNIPESAFKERFKKIYSARELAEFERLFRDNFIREEDFKNISLMGANTVRLPFNYRLLEIAPFRYLENGFQYLDKALSWAKNYNLGVILDLHAAPGAQNRDWHSDSKGRALLWENKAYQERVFGLWERIAERFKDRSCLIGYDLLNEPVLEKRPQKILHDFYKRAIGRLKAVDDKRLIFLEGDLWAQRIDFLRDLIEENIRISIHTYTPLDYTFNFTPFLRFPGRMGKVSCDKNWLRKHLEPYARFSAKNKVEIFVGEFGINWRGGFWGEERYLKNILEIFEEFGFSYTYWTYKAVAASTFPDGLYQQLANSKFVNRQGPVYGWESYLSLWRKDKSRLARFWRTRSFTPNRLAQVLGSFLKK